MAEDIAMCDFYRLSAHSKLNLCDLLVLGRTISPQIRTSGNTAFFRKFFGRHTTVSTAIFEGKLGLRFSKVLGNKERPFKPTPSIGALALRVCIFFRRC